MTRSTRRVLIAAVPVSPVFARMRVVAVVALYSLLAVAIGCGRLHKEPEGKYVYVTSKQAYLRDRVAAVSNRTGEVQNGEKLQVLDRARRMLKVRSPRGEVGWLEETKTGDQALMDRFEALREEHAKDPTVASAVTRDEVYLHAAPGRKPDDVFYRLPEGEKLNLLQRASVLKPIPPGGPPAGAAPATAHRKTGDDAAKPAWKSVAPSSDADPQPPPAPPMEDFWLVRDSKGDTGWIYAKMMDVDEPDALARYAEGQRIVGAYVLAHVDDPDSNIVSNGQTVTSIPEYVTVLSPFKSGLPYDFNQVRVFSWNIKKHRYETAFRQRNIAGYLPVVLAEKTNPYEKPPLGSTPLPSFTYRVLSGDAPLPTPDPATGAIKPGKTIEKTYRLEGSNCYRIFPPNQTPPPEAHPDPEPEKKDKGKHRK